MGRLIIDGNSVFELDENCLKKKKVKKYCDIEKYLKDTTCKREDNENKNKAKKY